jgi:hypothetical protein
MLAASAGSDKATPARGDEAAFVGLVAGTVGLDDRMLSPLRKAATSIARWPA